MKATRDWQRRRVVITGMGIISPPGLDLDTFWKNISDGISPVAPVTRFNSSHMPHHLAAEIKGFKGSNYMSDKQVRRSDLCTQYSIAAARLAMIDAGMKPQDIDPDRMGVIEGTTVSGMESTLRGHLVYLNKGYRAISPFDVINAYCGEGSSRIALELGIRGHAITYCSGCASGNDAIGLGMRMIRDDEVDVVIAGATDDNLAEPMYGGFCKLGVMSGLNDDGPSAMRPFDRTRDGFVLGEGGAFLVLEELAHALSRGAKIYAEVLGHGRSCEAFHETNTHPEGIGFCRAMSKALRDAGLDASQIDYINAHGTATKFNDPIETLAIRRVFGEAAKQVAISSTKPITGHMMGSAGAAEAVVCALAIKHQTLPPTINLTEADPQCDLDYVPRKARAYPVRSVLNLNAGFGGKNACLVLGEFTDQQ